MNKELCELGEVQWQYKQPGPDPLKIVQWLDEHLENTEMPMLDQLLDELATKCVKLQMLECSLGPAVIASKPDLRWQRRVEAAAEPIPHWMGSFGPVAYSTEHLRSDPLVGGLKMSHAELTEANCKLAASEQKRVLVDAHSGVCGVTVSAIQAGVFVKTAFEVESEEISTFEGLIGHINLGPIDYSHFEANKIPRSHLWWSSSQCKDYSPLGSRKGAKGSKGGDHFPNQSKYARASGSLALLWENVVGVATLNNGETFDKFKANCRADGFSSFWYQEVIFAQHGDPEDRRRSIGVAFHKSVLNEARFKFPAALINARACAADVLECSTKVHAKYWDYRPFHAQRPNWRSGDLKIFTLGYCNLCDKIGYPMTPSRIFHPMDLLPTSMSGVWKHRTGAHS